MPMTRFRQKIDRSLNSSTTRSIRNVVSTVVAPITSGRTAARAPRKKKIDSRISTGKASISARPRSSEICAPSWSLANSCPPSVTSVAALEALLQGRAHRVLVGRGAQRDRHVGGLAVARDEPRVAGGGRRRHRGHARDRARPRGPARRTSAARRRPSARSRRGAPAGSRCRPSAPWWRASSRSTAWAESESRSVKPPPASSRPATGPPTAAAKTVNSAATTRTRRGRAEMRLASAESMVATSVL